MEMQQDIKERDEFAGRLKQKDKEHTKKVSSVQDNWLILALAY